MQISDAKLPFVVWVSLCLFRGWMTDKIFKFQLCLCSCLLLADEGTTLVNSDTMLDTVSNNQSQYPYHESASVGTFRTRNARVAASSLIKQCYLMSKAVRLFSISQKAS